MSSREVLFEVTEDHLETGLRGFPVGYCPTSKVDPLKGLFYCDHPIASLTDWDPVKVIYLLSKGHAPSSDELKSFKDQISEYSFLPDGLKKHIESLPRQGHPMKMLSSALLVHGMLEKDSYEVEVLKLISRAPLICAHIINHHAGWKTPRREVEDFSYMGRFVDLLGLDLSALQRQELLRVMTLFNILHYDHGGGNLSCFTGKTIASGLEDAAGALSGAMSALEGPRHGRANQDCLIFVKALIDFAGEDELSEALVEEFLEQRLKKGELIYGFGHAVLRVEDPRASVQYDYASQHYGESPLVKAALLLRNVGPRVLKKKPKISSPYPNVDAISGTLLSAAGFAYPEYYTLLFGMSRIVGIGLQIVYERTQAREGRGTPIVRPKYIYKAR